MSGLCDHLQNHGYRYDPATRCIYTPDKREVVSSILTRPIQVNLFLATSKKPLLRGRFCCLWRISGHCATKCATKFPGECKYFASIDAVKAVLAQFGSINHLRIAIYRQLCRHCYRCFRRRKISSCATDCATKPSFFTFKPRKRPIYRLFCPFRYSYESST